MKSWWMACLGCAWLTGVTFTAARAQETTAEAPTEAEPVATAENTRPHPVLTLGGMTWIDVHQVTANDNGANGIYINAENSGGLDYISDLATPLVSMGGGLIDIRVTESQADNNGASGIRINATQTLDDLLGPVEARPAFLEEFGTINILAETAGSAAVTLTGNTADRNTSDGATITLLAESQTLLGRGNRLRNNGQAGLSLSVAADASANSLDFGTDGSDESGFNSIFGNGAYEIVNPGAVQLLAQNNYWGAFPPAAGQFSGAVNYEHELAADPNP
jgi:hypothetical protein